MSREEEMMWDDLNSEAMCRFYRAIVEFEDLWRWVKQTRFRYIQWRKMRWFKEYPPICHAGCVWGETD